MKNDNIQSNISDNVIDLLIAYGMLKSTVEVFSEAIDYNICLDNQYINMIKVIQKLVDEVDPCIKSLCESLEELSKSEEV